MPITPDLGRSPRAEARATGRDVLRFQSPTDRPRVAPASTADSDGPGFFGALVMTVVFIMLVVVGYQTGLLDAFGAWAANSMGLGKPSAGHSLTTAPTGSVKAPATKGAPPAAAAPAAATLAQAWGMLARYPTAEYLKVDPSAVGTRVPASDKQLAAFIVVESNGAPPAWFNRIHVSQGADGGVCLQTANAAGEVYSSRKGAAATAGPC